MMASTTRPRVLGTVFNPRNNALNFLRVVMALLVIVSHSWPVASYGPEPALGSETLGGFGVAGFFAISGYLITMSREHSPTLGRYLWKRFLRIYPAFFVALVVVAFIFAPVASTVFHDGEYEPASAVGYVFNNITMWVRQKGIEETLRFAPMPEVWNGPLWTLICEFACYLIIGVLMSFVRGRSLRVMLILAMGVLSAGLLILLIAGIEIPVVLFQGVRLWLLFTAGALLYLYRDRVRLVWGWTVVALVALVVTIVTGVFEALGALPFAYLILLLGIVLPFTGVGRKNDISYGLYIYAWPFQQLLQLQFGNALPPAVYILLATLLTVPVAWLSWVLVERPAQRLKNWSPGIRRSTQRDH